MKNKTYEINSQLRSWNYSSTLSTHNISLYAFYVYLFTEEPDKLNYKCRCIIHSPPFKICASRRTATKNKINKFEYPIKPKFIYPKENDENITYSYDSINMNLNMNMNKNYYPLLSSYIQQQNNLLNINNVQRIITEERLSLNKDIMELDQPYCQIDKYGNMEYLPSPLSVIVDKLNNKNNI